MGNEEVKYRVLVVVVLCCCVKERKFKGLIEMRDIVWWQYGYVNWIDKQF